MTDLSFPSDAAAVSRSVVHLPRSEDFLLWPPCLQSYGYRIVDQLFATRTVARGAAVRELARGPEARVQYVTEGVERGLPEFMDRNNVAGLLAMRDGRVVLERYGLGLQPHDRWSTMSTIKSVTSLLVGAAVQDGAIRSIDDPVTRYLPVMRGCAYENVTVRHLMTMCSGMEWTEDYTDKQSDVNRYSKSLADKAPGGVLALLRACRQQHAPGAVWHYNTGDTYLLGALISAATGMTLADYLSRKMWQPYGMEFDAFYTLESEGGQEIGGSRAGMTLRDLGRVGQFVLDDGVIGGKRVLPKGWIEEAGAVAHTVPEAFHSASRQALGLTGYGYSWWLREDGAMMAMGHSGQRIYIDRRHALVVVQLAAYPEPRYASANEPDRDAELSRVIAAIRDGV
ncbi:serine hydrolase [Achromobacter sp. UMC46]|uniref:serine hydrolase domain-containing protein n=1 Tax=Achromobacter sp. UMC46 TaxID=1862319 RepID=UPI00160120C9|nr:serine hydrolase [Achromobacter sp. UMC46]MBB1595375.1 serine hydrolase [Achromobacter sp. UMC46]